MSINKQSIRWLKPLILCVPLFVADVLAVTPGVDIAVPRDPDSKATDQLIFTPADLVVEQGDFVRWVYASISFTHTTTSGANCTFNGLWSASLTPTSTQFAEQFSFAPGPFPYFCSPHCLCCGMKGVVTVTLPISLGVTDAGGITDLSWSSGSGTYRVFRSNSPAFTPAGTTVLAGSTGTTQTTLTDIAVPPPGEAAYYLVMNWFATTQF